MLIDQVLYPVETLGPGKRVAIWVVGCTRGCAGCSNPELWSKEDCKSVSPIELFSAIKQISVDNPVDGFTITGGEPMDQAKELLELVKLLRLINSDILVFSGYTHQELLKNTTQREILNEIAVLVDGPYIESLNNALPLRGSSNQNILLFDLTHESRYADYLNTEKKRIQNFYFDDQTVSVGIHDVAFKDDLNATLKELKVREKTNEGSKMAQ